MLVLFVNFPLLCYAEAIPVPRASFNHFLYITSQSNVSGGWSIGTRATSSYPLQLGTGQKLRQWHDTDAFIQRLIHMLSGPLVISRGYPMLCV